MKGTMLIKKLNPCLRCIVGDENYDEKVGGKFWFVLDPFFNCEEEPFFYYKKVENGYLVEGEAYICTSKEQAEKHRARTNRSLKTIQYIENQNLTI